MADSQSPVGWAGAVNLVAPLVPDLRAACLAFPIGYSELNSPAEAAKFQRAVTAKGLSYEFVIAVSTKLVHLYAANEGPALASTTPMMSFTAGDYRLQLRARGLRARLSMTPAQFHIADDDHAFSLDIRVSGLNRVNNAIIQMIVEGARTCEQVKEL